MENKTETVANQLQGGLSANTNMGIGTASNCITATPCGPLFQQYPYLACNHNIGADEELLLNAIRRKPEMKAILLKTALTELLKGL